MKPVLHQVHEKKTDEFSFISEFFYLIKDQVLKIDFLQVIPMCLLICYGIVFIYSAGQQVGGGMLDAWKKQLIWTAIGLVFWIILTFSQYRILGLLSPFVYLASILLLVIVLIVGIKMYGAKRWLNLGSMSIQPAEFAKIATLLLIARIASLSSFNINNLYHLVGIIILAILPFILILKQPDLGSALVFVVILAAVVFAARISWKKIIIIFLSVLIIIPISYPFLKDYQKERILVFLNVNRDPLNQGWTSRQTLLAVGSGGFVGKGLLHGTQNALGFLPQNVSNSDLIFSVIAEESGFVGSISLILLYTLLIFSMLRTACFARDEFGYFLAIGMAALFFEHSLINIGMNIRLIPVTGLPLPLVSYGGSFMITSLICLGILQAIYIHREKQK